MTAREMRTKSSYAFVVLTSWMLLACFLAQFKEGHEDFFVRLPATLLVWVFSLMFMAGKNAFYQKYTFNVDEYKWFERNCHIECMVYKILPVVLLGVLCLIWYLWPYGHDRLTLSLVVAASLLSMGGLYKFLEWIIFDIIIHEIEYQNDWEDLAPFSASFITWILQAIILLISAFALPFVYYMMYF